MSGTVKTADGVFQMEGSVLKRCVLHFGNHIRLPAGVSAIGDQAFYRDSSLESVSCPDTLREIGAEAFSQCTALRWIDLGSGLQKIGVEAFWNCASLETVRLPDSLEEIAWRAFGFCGALKKIHLPNSGVQLGEGVFFQCKSLAKVHLPHTLQALPDELFHGCAGLRRIWLPDSVSEIGRYALAECGLNTLPVFSGIERLRPYAFWGNKNTSKITVPRGIAVIPEGCFGMFWSAKEVLIPHTVKRIEKLAFAGLGCPVYLPDSVEEIHEDAFYRAGSGLNVSIPGHLEGRLPPSICVVRN